MLAHGTQEETSNNDNPSIEDDINANDNDVSTNGDLIYYKTNRILLKHSYTCSIFRTRTSRDMGLPTCSHCDDYRSALTDGTNHHRAHLPIHKWGQRYQCMFGGFNRRRKPIPRKLRISVSYQESIINGAPALPVTPCLSSSSPSPSNMNADCVSNPPKNNKRLRPDSALLSTPSSQLQPSTVTPNLPSSTPNKRIRYNSTTKPNLPQSSPLPASTIQYDQTETLLRSLAVRTSECNKLRTIVRDLSSEISQIKRKHKQAIAELTVHNVGSNVNLPVPDNDQRPPTSDGVIHAPFKHIDLTEFGNRIEQFVGSILGHRWLQTKARTLCSALFSGKIFGQKIEPELKKNTRLRMQKIFQPWKLQRMIDTGPPGSLNYESINLLRDIEDLHKYERGGLCERTAVQRSARKLEKHGDDNILKLTPIDTPFGPGFKIDLEQAVRLILRAYDLEQHATTGPVSLATTMDGGTLFGTSTHVTAGIKIIDLRAKEPITGAPLFLNTGSSLRTNLPIGSGTKIQSRDVCFPLLSIFAKDKKELYKEEFSDFYSFFSKLQEEGLPENDNGPAVKPMKIVSPQDLSSFWKVLGMGGGSFSTDLFCHCCTCRRSEKANYKQGASRCERCISKNKQNCYHHDVCDNELLEHHRVELAVHLGENLEEHYHTYDKIEEKSVILTDVNVVNRLTNSTHLDYEVPEDDPSQEVLYRALLIKELAIRHPSQLRQFRSKAIEELRTRLREDILLENRVREIRCALERNDKTEHLRMILLDQAIPCILHAENRIGEKLIKTLLDDVTRRYSDGNNNHKRELLIQRLTKIMKQEVLGRDSQWVFPWDDKEKKVHEVTLPNTKARKIMNGLDKIVEEACKEEYDQRSDHETRVSNILLSTQWLSILGAYRPLMVMARNPFDFTDEQVEEFQDMADDFFSKWLHRFGEKHVTNYIHMFGAGHMQYYLRTYRNLYRYSNQGWEALNAKYKGIYYSNTNKGGSCGGGEHRRKKSHLDALGRFSQRFILWSTGVGTVLFENEQQETDEWQHGEE